MAAAATALLYALFVWWFSTGLVMLLVLRQRSARTSLAAAAILFPVALLILARSSTQTGIAGVYVAFTAAVLLWGSQEIAFLTGCITGPRPLGCPPEARGLARLGFALGAILYHELALVGSLLAAVAVTWGGANQAGVLTFLVLWIMRISAKLNLFLGVPELNDGFLPDAIGFIRSYFRRDSVNAFFPLSVLLSVILCCGFILLAIDPEATPSQAIGYALVAALVGLAILEHLFMLMPLPLDKLWRWSTGGRSGRASATRMSRGAARPDVGTMERILPTRP